MHPACGGSDDAAAVLVVAERKLEALTAKLGHRGEPVGFFGVEIEIYHNQPANFPGPDSDIQIRGREDRINRFAVKCRIVQSVRTFGWQLCP